MATTIIPATLTVTISEQVILNNQPINSENKLTIASITQVDKRIVSIPTSSEVTLVDFAASVAAGTFVSSNLKYVRVTNKDAVNYARIRVKKSGADTFDVRLDAGKSFIMGNTDESVSATAATFTTFVTMGSILAQANTAAVDVELFVASI